MRNPTASAAKPTKPYILSLGSLHKAALKQRSDLRKPAGQHQQCLLSLILMLLGGIKRSFWMELQELTIRYGRFGIGRTLYGDRSRLRRRLNVWSRLARRPFPKTISGWLITYWRGACFNSGKDSKNSRQILLTQVIP